MAREERRTNPQAKEVLLWRFEFECGSRRTLKPRSEDRSFTNASRSYKVSLYLVLVRDPSYGPGQDKLNTKHRDFFSQ
jgi:hypothetical protein